MSRAKIVPVALHFAGGWIREAPAGSNGGRWVEAIQRIGNGRRGDAWCAGFVTMLLDIAYQGKNPLPATMSCDVMLAAARKVGRERRPPQAGDVFFVMAKSGAGWSKSDAIHVGIVASVARGADGVLRIGTIEGNTNDGGSREGWGALARTRDATKALTFVQLPA